MEFAAATAFRRVKGAAISGRAGTGSWDAKCFGAREDGNGRRPGRLTPTGAGVRQGGLTEKDVKNTGRSGDVYENKGEQDIMAENKSDNESENAEI